MTAGVVDALLRRVDHTLDEAAGRYPVTAEPGSGRREWSDDGWWTGGFWAGLLRPAARSTGDDRHDRAAADASAALAGRAGSPTLLCGFLFWYGDGLAAALGGAAASPVMNRATAALADDLDPVGRRHPCACAPTAQWLSGSVAQDATYDRAGTLVEQVATNGVRPDYFFLEAALGLDAGLDTTLL